MAGTKTSAKPTSRKASAPAKPRGAVAATRAPGNQRPVDIAAELAAPMLVDGEVSVGELAAAVIASGRTKLAGKTPAATVAAQIYVSAKKGELFRKASRGKVALLAAS